MFRYESVRNKEVGKGGDVDLEAGDGQILFRGISPGENQLHCGLIRKVYGILSAQLVLTTFVSASTVLYAPLNDLLRGSPGFLPFVRTYASKILKSLENS